MEEVRNGIMEKKVCVTGASGYIASWLVKLLLQRGYIVHATIRDPSDPMKTEHLVGLEGAKERLQIFKADLMEEGSFDSSFVGCECVFHTASPVIFKPKDPQVDVLEPAVKGTMNVLKSCKKFPSIKRVIFTSTMGTMLQNGRTLAPHVVVDESWYSDIEICKGSEVMCYVLSKVIAEENAWEFAKENKMDLISMNPGMVIGPMLQPTLNESVAAILGLIDGSKETYPNFACPWIDVKDVAEAHIRAFEMPSAKGRYLLAESVVHFSDILKIIHELYPTIKLPYKPELVHNQPETSYQVSQSKAKSLGIEYIPFKESLKSTIENLKEKNFV